MAKRGRPRKAQSVAGESNAASTALLGPDDDPEIPPVARARGLYDEEYRGRRWWLVGVKRDPERGVPPFHHQHYGLIEFCTGLQRQITTDDGHLGLDGHRRRIYAVRVPHSYISRSIRKIRHSFVRWQRRLRDDGKGGTEEVWAATVMSTLTRHKVRDPRTRDWVPGDQPVNQFLPGDVPISRYLVLLPKKRAQELGLTVDDYQEFQVGSAPSVFDVDPSLCPEAGQAWYDEDDEDGED